MSYQILKNFVRESFRPRSITFMVIIVLVGSLVALEWAVGLSQFSSLYTRTSEHKAESRNVTREARDLMVNRWGNCTTNPSDSMTEKLLTSYDSNVTIGLSQWPTWIKDLCPEVIDHFSKYPYFTRFLDKIPTMTTLYAAHSACSMRIADQVAAAADTEIYIWAGSHLGAVVHGGPIPWDDDVDMIFSYDRKKAFLTQCRRMEKFHPDAKLKCTVGFNAIKLSVITSDSYDTTNTWKSPFVDIFLIKTDDEKLYEVTPEGRKTQSFPLKDFLPTRPFYFAGIELLGPQPTISLKRYNINKCVVGSWNHRLEEGSPHGVTEVDCCILAQHLPFLYSSNDGESFVFDGSSVEVLPPMNARNITGN